jgi:hypothetical protein
MKRRNKLMTAVGMAGLVAVAMQLRPGDVTAADHVDSPQTEADPAGDIADLYAWHDDVGRLTVVLTFDGDAANGGDPVSEATYDPDVLYTIHIDQDGDNVSDNDIYVRFGQNLLEEWGVRVDNLPGEKASFEGPVDGEVTGKGGGRAWAGRFEDPFFFDLQGYIDTLASATMDPAAGNLMFDNTRDFFEGRNVTAIVLEMDAAAATGENTTAAIWATTGRITPR